MYFVDNIHFIPRLHRAVLHGFHQLAHVINTGVAGGIHLEDIRMLILGNGAAIIAHSAGGNCRRIAPSPWLLAPRDHQTWWGDIYGQERGILNSILIPYMLIIASVKAFEGF
jgi:hypothetical protein